MTLLSATSTIRKRISLIFLLFMLLSAPLFGAPYIYKVVGDNPSFISSLSDVLGVYEDVTSPAAFEEVRERLERGARLDWEKARSSLLSSENFTSLEKLEMDSVSLKSLTLTESDHNFSDREKELIKKYGREAVDYYRRLYGIDMLITAFELTSEPVVFMRLESDGEDRIDFIWKGIDDEETKKRLLDYFLSKLEADNVHLYSFTMPPSGTLEIDGKVIDSFMGSVALNDGEHTVVASAPGYITLTETINVDGFTDTIPLNLERIEGAPIFVSPLPYSAELFYDATGVEGHIIKDAVYPFTVTASSPGFSPYSLSSMARLSKIEVDLRPAWMEGADLVKEKKGDFYESLFTTLVLFGGWISSGVLDNLYPDNNLGPLRTLTGGVAIVSLVNLIGSIFDYYRSAQYGL